MVRLTPARRVAPAADVDRRSGRRRRHRVALRQLDRDALERRGWRTTLELCENHVRTSDGRLVEVETWWIVAAERHAAGHVEVITARARSEARAWSRLLVESTIETPGGALEQRRRVGELVSGPTSRGAA